MAEPQAWQNTQFLYRTAIAIIGILGTALFAVSLVVLNDIKSDVDTIRVDVQLLLRSEPRISQNTRDIENILDWIRNHEDMAAHDNHPHPHGIVEFREFLEREARR